MIPQVKATLKAFTEYFDEATNPEDFYYGSVKMCYEIDEELEDGSIIGRTMVYSGQNKDGHPMVRDKGKFEISSNGEIMRCDGLLSSTCDFISEKGLKLYEEEH
tara:strand:+ start:116 stop:427 length:312 start_codon:yes stop_codon:yes gene_type:complete